MFFNYFALFAIFHFQSSKQEKCGINSCSFDLNETFSFMENLTSSTDTFLKDSLLQAAKESFGKMENLPKKIKEKLKDDLFLKEKIEKVLENEKKRKQRKSQSKQDKHDSARVSAPARNSSKFSYSPYGGAANIKNWDDLYHYYPQLGTTIRLWKLQFKESAMANAKKFKGCANPADMVDWLVPDIEDVKKSNKHKK